MQDRQSERPELEPIPEQESNKPPYNKETLIRSGVIFRAFSSPDGQAALDLLKEEFHDRTTFDSDPIQMARKTAHREVILFIIDLMNIKERR